MSNQDTYKVNPNVRFRRVFDEGVVIHQERAEALVLNDTAMAFLELCDGERTLDDILNKMTEQFDVGSEMLQADLAVFLDQLEAEGIINRVE